MKMANKGEWSELYALLLILAYGKIRETDASLKGLDQFMEVEECFGPGGKAECAEYKIHANAKEVEVYYNGGLHKVLSMETLADYANEIYEGIAKGEGTFAIKGAEDVIEEIGCAKIKSPSYNKADIQIRTAKDKKPMGYSIKSFLGGNPTLINASKQTNFRYEVIGISEEEAKRINDIEGRAKIRNRIEKIGEYGGVLAFDGVCSPQFSKNLESIDPEMSKIIACMLLEYFSGSAKTCSEIADKLENKNPLHFLWTNDYKNKIIKFLSVMEIGMVPAKPWNGEERASGGEIILKKDGGMLVFRSYQTYERNGFERYLFENTYLDTPSPSRHGFGSIYSGEGKMWLNLNLQVRLKE